MRITLLGTGTPAPSLRRASSGYILDIGDDVIVVDHGPGAHHRLLEAGRKATEVTHCFLSHLHYDHFMDYPRLLMTRWDQGAGKQHELQVYGPEPIARLTDLLIGKGGLYDLDLEARTKARASLDIYESRGGVLPRLRPKPEVRELKVGDKVEGKGWRVTVGSGWHAEPYLNCLAFRFDTDEGSLCYTGDSGGICPGIVELAKGCDMLIHMCHYFSGTEPTPEYRRFCGNHIDVAEVARQAGVQVVVLTHLTEQIDQPRVRERMIREMSAIFDGDIVIGEDLMQLGVVKEALHRID